MSKNVRNSSRTDFNGKDTTRRTLKARKKVGGNFLPSSRSVSQQLMICKKKVVGLPHRDSLHQTCTGPAQDLHRCYTGVGPEEEGRHIQEMSLEIPLPLHVAPQDIFFSLFDNA